MIAQPARARRLGLGLLAASAVLLSGCAAGEHAQTAFQTPSIDGTNVIIGALQLHVLVVQAPPTGTGYAAGTDARLRVAIVNTGAKDDTLTGISGPFATWGMYDSDAAATAAEAGTSSASDSTGASPSASSSPSTSSTSSTSSAGSSLSASPSATTTAPVPGQTSVPLPGGTNTSFGGPSDTRVLLLQNLSQVIQSGNSYRFTFTFANAGSVQVFVPVGLSPAGSVPGSTIPPVTGASAG